MMRVVAFKFEVVYKPLRRNLDPTAQHGLAYMLDMN